jgi:lysyl-tRNA synthetase class 2
MLPTLDGLALAPITTIRRGRKIRSRFRTGMRQSRSQEPSFTFIQKRHLRVDECPISIRSVSDETLGGQSCDGKSDRSSDDAGHVRLPAFLARGTMQHTMVPKLPPYPHHPTADWPALRLRAELLRRLRLFFEAQRFLEVETPLLSNEVIVDRYLEPFCTTFAANPRCPHDGTTLWLQTSPEAAMKRLLAAGGDAIYQVTRSFRNAEQGRLHNPEFTIVEWYRTGDTMSKGMDLLADLCRELLRTPAAERTSYRQAFLQFARIDPFAAEVRDLVAEAAADGWRSNSETDADRDDLLDFLLTTRVQPFLGNGAPLILYDYPPTQAALARVRNEVPPVAERFELFWKGVELANGYHELTDPDELKLRLAEVRRLRACEGKRSLPEPVRLLDALRQGLPPCTGVALGLDRLVMLAAEAESIEQVITFPIDRA